MRAELRKEARSRISHFTEKPRGKQCVFTVFIEILTFSCEMSLNFTPKISLDDPYDRI